MAIVVKKVRMLFVTRSYAFRTKMRREKKFFWCNLYVRNMYKPSTNCSDFCLVWSSGDEAAACWLYRGMLLSQKEQKCKSKHALTAESPQALTINH